MPFVRRDEQGQGQIEGPQRGSGHEFLDEGHLELLTFVGVDASADFNQFGAGFARVFHRVIDTPIVRNIQSIADLPEQARATLFARKIIRKRVSKIRPQLFEPADFVDVIRTRESVRVRSPGRAATDLQDPR